MALPVEIAQRLSPEVTALLVIDVQRRHLDVDGAGYHTLPPDRARSVTANTAAALSMARSVHMPVVHVGTWTKPGLQRPGLGGGNPFIRWQNGKQITGADFVRQAGRCTQGSVYAEFMPGCEPLADEPVVVKFSYSGFYMTELDLVLRNYGVTDLLVAGVNTNNCVLHTSFDANARDFGVILLEDCAGSMNGDQYHEMGVAQISASIGWTSTIEEVSALLRVAAPVGAER